MVSFENVVKSMLPSLSKLKVTPTFCFAFKIPDDVTASNIYKYFAIYLSASECSDIGRGVDAGVKPSKEDSSV